ncbi:MAG: Gmad2 immunoglobulin-like domain-containing protein [Thermoflexales bacterium]|nr:Gmad2 immunoglobulin-like domain-containing protein [Thermoflexales bacterium]
MSQTIQSRRLVLGLMILSLSTLACGFVGGAFSTPPVSEGPTSGVPKVPMVIETATPTVVVPGAAAPGATTPEGAAPQSAAAQPSGPLESIVITSPLSDQGVRSGFVVAGVADPTFEQRLTILVRDQTGKVIGSAAAQIQAPIGQRGPYSATVQLPPNLPAQPGRVIVYAISARDGGPVQLSSVEVQLNSDAPSTAAAPDPNQREAIVITAPQPGALLQKTVHVVAETMYTENLVIEVRGPDNETLGRVMRTLENAEGLPAPLIVDVPFRVNNDPPGRIVIYVIHPRDGKTIHLSSVEVNLQP